MRVIHRAAIALAMLAALLGFAASAQTPPPTRLVITGARILDVASGRYREASAIVVEGDRITGFGEPPADSGAPVNRLDATGRTVVPGLIDLAARALPTVDLDVDYFYALSLAHGVTALRVVDTVLPWSATQRDRVRRGEISAPRLWTSGPVLVARSGGLLAMLALGEPTVPSVAVDPASAGREAARQADTRVDWIRVGGDAGPDTIKAVVGALGKRSVGVSAAPGATSMAQLATLGVDAIDGLAAPARALERPDAQTDLAVLLDAAWTASSAGDLASLARRVSQGRARVIPMLRLASARVTTPRDDAIQEELALVPERLRAARRDAIARASAGAAGSSAARAWEAKRRFVAALARSGASLGVASGASQDGWPVPGLAVHHELALLVAAGLTPAEAIRAATMGGAATLRATRTLGELRPGASADFFIVDGDPLADIAALRKITHVVSHGEVLDPKALLARAKRAGGRGR